jgi:hypothetical protein
MPVRILIPPRRRDRWDGPQVMLAALTVVGAAAAGLSAWMLPVALVLPILSILVIAAAGLTALIAWMRPQRRSSDRITYWDIAGALTFIGLCAALLSDPEQALPLFEARRPQ